MIELVQLTKRYDKNEKLALDHIDYFTNQTCPLGIVGSNGAGKSTMFMLANGLARPTSGSVRLLGKDLVGIYGISKKEYENRIKMFYIDEFENSKIDSLSTGMLKRVMLLISMLHMPDILFLDEPFSGLDMDAKNELSEAIQYLYREKNIKIVISSHDLFETQDLIEDVMILEAGRIIEAGKYDDLIRKYSKVKKLRVVCEDDAVILGSYSKLVRKREAGQMELCMGIEELYSFLEGVDRRKVINIINNDMSLGDIYEEARKHANISNGEKGD